MPKEINIPENIIGLTDSEVLTSRNEFGSNEQSHKTEYKWWLALLEMFKEPMLLLLIAVAIIYFILGENSEAYFMLAAIVAVSGISFFKTTAAEKH